MTKFIKVLLSVLTVAIMVGMFTKVTSAEKKLSETEQNYEQLKQEKKKITKQAQESTTVVHVIVDHVEGNYAYTLPIDDNDEINDYILVKKRNYEQGSIVTVTMDGLGEVVKDEYTLNEELTSLYKRFGDIIADYNKGFEYNAQGLASKQEEKQVEEEKKAEPVKKEAVKQAKEKKSEHVESKPVVKNEPVENKSVEPVKQEAKEKAQEKNISNNKKQDEQEYEFKEKDDSYINSVRQYRITETTNAGLINAEGAKNGKEKVILENKGFREGDIVEVKYGTSGYHDDMVEVKKVEGEKKPLINN